MIKSKSLRLFLDSNVLTGGILSSWGLDKAILALCAARICRLVLAEYVIAEVEDNLLNRASTFPTKEASQILDDYVKLLKLAKPEIIPLPSLKEVSQSRKLIAHEADVPVLLSAIKATPDWLLTHNTKHFTPEVTRKTGIKILTPAEFFRVIAVNVNH